MRKSYFHLLGGVLFSLPLLFASCGNGDNALEEIIKNGGSGGGSGEGGGSSTVAVTSVTLDKAYLRFDKNVLTAQTLTATVAPADATDKTVTWTSSDETVATVDADGNVTPIKVGTATIKATSGDKTATSTVYIYDNIVDINTVNDNVTVLAGESWLINGDGTEVAYSITIGAGAKATLNGISIKKQMICSDTGDATIILADGSTNTVDNTSGTETLGIYHTAGIKVGGAGTTLTIDAETAGTGTLTAKGGDRGAGIGTNGTKSRGTYGSTSLTFGNIIIKGGIIDAKGGAFAAGIGTGMANDGPYIVLGNITIKGGTITATGGLRASGIGTGWANQSDITCGAIKIEGGEVTATGGTDGAGIGTGRAAIAGLYHSNTCGTITISADVTSVTATKGLKFSIGKPNSIIGVGVADGDVGTQVCGVIKFGNTEVYDGDADADKRSTYNSMTAGTYGGLNLAISTTTNTNDTWTLTPVAP